MLLVEDDVDAQDIYAKTLAHEGFEVVLAPSIAEATATARTLRLDVVVLDCRLPDGDGLELARTWRSDPTMRSVPVVVLTAFSSRQDVEAAILAGADAFVVKPCPGHVLAKHIDGVLKGTHPSQKLRRPLT